MAKSKQISMKEATAAVDRWITITNKSESDPAVIDIDGFIGEDFWSYDEDQNTTTAIKNKLKEIAAVKNSKIIVNINSLGGSLNHGFGIHDILAQHDAEIETNVQGMTASAATIIAQAGDVRKMSDNALYLIHQPWSMFIANVSEMDAIREDLAKMNDRLVNIYVKRSGRDESEIRELINENTGNGKWIDADEALEMGLIDEKYEPMKAAASHVRPDEFGNGVMKHLPPVPDTKLRDHKHSNIMKEETKSFIDKAVEAIRAAFGADEKEELPDGVQSQIDALTERVEAAEKEVETVSDSYEGKLKEANDKIAELEGQVEALTTETGERDKTIETANARIEELETELVKAEAKSTKPAGPKGAEDKNEPANPELAQLDADVAKLKNKHEIVVPDPALDQ